MGQGRVATGSNSKVEEKRKSKSTATTNSHEKTSRATAGFVYGDDDKDSHCSSSSYANDCCDYECNNNNNNNLSYYSRLGTNELVRLLLEKAQKLAFCQKLLRLNYEKNQELERTVETLKQHVLQQQHIQIGTINHNLNPFLPTNNWLPYATMPLQLGQAAYNNTNTSNNNSDNNPSILQHTSMSQYKRWQDSNR